MTYVRRLIDKRRDRNESSTSLYHRYQQAEAAGDQRKADAIYRDYLRACEAEMHNKQEINAQQQIRRAS